MKDNKRSIISWCIYDWANSSVSTVILTFIFATYFTKEVALNTIVGTAQWGNAIAISGLAIAILGPILGAIADSQGKRKPWIICFTLLSILSCFLLWYAKPHPVHVTPTLFKIILAVVGMEVAFIFYNAMLHDIAPKHYLGRISGWAWALGYAGGLTCLIICLVLFVKGHYAWLPLNTKTFENLRATGPFVAIWFFIFSLPLFFFTKDMNKKVVPIAHALHRGLHVLWKTLCSLRHYKEIVKFLLARMFYIDGLNTIFAFGGIYAAGTFGMSFSEVIEFGIAMNVAAGLGAASFAWLDDWFGAKPTILLALGLLLFTGSGILLVTSKTMFWVFGMGVSVCVGPIQAASRSLMVRLAPKEMLTEMFGLYALSGKVTTFLGPWVLGVVTLHFNSQRLGMSTVLVFVVVGTILLLSVNEPKG